METDSIAIVTQPGGKTVTTQHTNTLTTLINHYATVTLITANANDPDQYTADNIIEYTSNPGSAFSRQALWFWVNQLRLGLLLARRPEPTILFFGTQLYWIPILISRLTGKRTLVLPRGNVPDSMYYAWYDSFQEQHLLLILTRVFTVIIGFFEYLGYLFASEIIVYSRGVAYDLNLRQFDYKLHEDGARFVDTPHYDITTPYEDRDHVVGYVGRFSPEKNIPRLIDVVRELPEWITFVFVGDGQYRDLIEDELAEEIQAGRVEVTGWVGSDDACRHLNRFRALLLLSHTESIPTSVLQAQSCGCPVVSSDASGLPDVVLPGLTGQTISDDQSPREISRIVTRIVENQDQDSTLLSQNSRRLILSEYSETSARERWRSILTETPRERQLEYHLDARNKTNLS